MRFFLSLIVFASGLFAGNSFGWAEGYPIAGTQPYERPAGAPVVTEHKKDDAWFAKALKGVSTPYPESLRFLNDQGAWFTPFNHPGMTGRYDIRNWYDE